MDDKAWLCRVPLSRSAVEADGRDARLDARAREHHGHAHSAAEPAAEPAGGDAEPDARILEHLGVEECLRLLAAAPYGRAVFVHGGRPEIRPLTHLVDGGEVIVRTRLGAALAGALAVDGGLRVSFQADALDLDGRVGWSVIVSGVAAPVGDPERAARHRARLRTLLASADDAVVAIRPDTASGIRIVPVAATAPAAGDGVSA